LIAVKAEGIGHLELQRKIFTGPNKLQLLDLKDNNLNFIEDFSFKDLKSLEILRLNNNSLTKLSENIFVGLESLRKLYLSHNDISLVGESVFHALQYLVTLDMTQKTKGVNKYWSQTTR
jgi:Leucine rich repeat